MKPLRLLWTGTKEPYFTYIIARGQIGLGVIFCDKNKVRIKILKEHKHRIKVEEVEDLIKWLPAKTSK